MAKDYTDRRGCSEPLFMDNVRRPGDRPDKRWGSHLWPFNDESGNKRKKRYSPHVGNECYTSPELCENGFTVHFTVDGKEN